MQRILILALLVCPFALAQESEEPKHTLPAPMVPDTLLADYFQARYEANVAAHALIDANDAVLKADRDSKIANITLNAKAKLIEDFCSHAGPNENEYTAKIDDSTHKPVCVTKPAETKPETKK